MATKTAIDDAGDWLPIAAALIGLGVLPKSFRPAVSALGTGYLVYTIGRKLGWF